MERLFVDEMALETFHFLFSFLDAALVFINQQQPVMNQQQPVMNQQQPVMNQQQQ